MREKQLTVLADLCDSVADVIHRIELDGGACLAPATRTLAFASFILASQISSAGAAIAHFLS